MATAKKSTTKKPVKSAAAKTSAAKKAPVKKTTTTKAVTVKTPVKKTSSRKSTSKSATTRVSTKKTGAKQQEMRSFRVARESQEFTNFQITKQTVYWIILVAFIIFVQLWILKLQVEVATLLDAQQAQLSEQI